MRPSAVRIACICLALAAANAAGTTQDRGLPDITIPVAPAEPTITATVSLITGPAPGVTAEAIQLGGDSGLAIMQGVALEEAKAWSRPVPWSPYIPMSLDSLIIEPPHQTAGEEPALAPGEYGRALAKSLLGKPLERRDVEVLRRVHSTYGLPGGMGASPSDYLPPELQGGLAVKSESRELALDEEQAIELSWPDDRPRYYLEQQADDLFRRVQLADKEGYAVRLRASRLGGNLKVDLDLTRNTLAGGRYDGTINAYVGKPTLIKTICQTSAPVTAGTATIVTWNVLTSPGRDRAALARALYEQGLATLDDVRIASGLGPDPELAKIRYREGLATLGDVMAATAAAAPSGAMPGLAIVLSTQPVPAAAPPAPAPEPPDAPAAEPATPAEGEPAAAKGAGAQVQVDLKFVEVPVGSAAWEKLGEGSTTALATESAVLLGELAAQGEVRVIASPSLIALDNQKAELQIGQLEPYALGLDGGEVELGIQVSVTPRILQAEGEVLLTLEFRFDELLDKVQGVNADPAAVVGTRATKVLLRMPPGETALFRGLVRMDREVGEDGKAVKRPVETVILVTPRVLTEGVRD